MFSNIMDIDKCLFMLPEVVGLEAKFSKYALYMKALSDETRVRIFDMISGGELCACRILEEFNITQPTLSYHMKILCDSGLVNGRRDGVWMKYSINRDSLAQVRKFFDGIGERIGEQSECCKR
jgi:ArsR family transcriptional regulator